MRRLAIISAFLAAFALQAAAQGSISVNVQNLVAADEQFSVTFTIEGEARPSEFEWEPGDDFQLVWGPQKGTSTSISIVNGKKTQTSQTTYTYVLMPRAAGNFTLPAATATIKGNKISSRSVAVQVVSGGSSRSGQSAQGQGGTQQGGEAAPSGDDIFMRLSVSKTKAVVGETITATLKLYHRVNVAGFEDARFPSFNGFWSQELQAPQNIEFHRENVGDRIYDAAVLRSWTLIPQQAGELTIDPAELVCLVNVRDRRSSSGSIFDSFFQDEYRTVRKRVSTPAVKINVSRIPAGAPASFGGGVGSFRMNASLSRDSLQTHDAGTLKITVSGKGNVSLLEAPKVNFPPDFEVYDIKTATDGNSKTFEYPFIPRSHGEFVLGPIEYSYYDASAGKFVTLRSEAMPIKVSRSAQEPQAGGGSGQLVAAPSRKDVKDLGSDIRFIATRKPQFARAGWFFVGSGAFWAIVALLCAIAAGLYFGLRKIAARRADVVGSKNRGATKMARKRLSLAGQFLQKDLYTAFYEELHKALLGFVSDKLNMPAADLSKDNISERLVAGGCPRQAAERFTGLLDACEFARYAPSEGHEAMASHYEGAVSVISEIDASMKKKHKSGAAAVITALLLLAPFHGIAGQEIAGQAGNDVNALWEAGVAAYADGQWEEARDAWLSISAQGLESAELYYNIGNAYFKSSELGHAILWYERVLKADPSYADARFNLEFANSLIQDRIEEVPEFFLETWGRKMCWLLPSGVWAALCLILLAGTLAMLLLFLMGRGGARKLGFFAGLVLLLGTLLCLDFAFWQRTDALKNDSAIVMKPVCEVKSSPGSGVNLFVLHEGTKVKVIEEVGGWSNIELADGRRGWLKNENFDYICTFRNLT
ncbi:MAG: BatD family protein [Bacteroidales bacterium]|nr:BatD family protein [Bacteroidales bacterium]